MAQKRTSLIVIPARFQSSRLPGKPLRQIWGETMIKRVHERCSETGLDTVVATDDERIANECVKKSMDYVMTSPDCLTGTDRVAEVAKAKPDYKGYINVQGDEPFVTPSDILMISDLLCNSYGKAEVLCGMCRIEEPEQYYSQNVPKIAFNQDRVGHSGLLRYISRAPIPGVKANMGWPKGNAWKQVCIYGFSSWHLHQFTEQKEKTTLEYIEDIEILRFLEIGIPVRMVMIQGSPLAVDTENDLNRANDLYEHMLEYPTPNADKEILNNLKKGKH